MASQDRVTTQSTLALAQGAYFALTGLWGLLHDRSFQWITGPKTDVWLLKTVSVLVTAIGAALAWAGMARRSTPEVGLLGVTSAAGLMAIDCYYVAKGRISPIYLLDAVAEAGLVAAWLSAWLTDESTASRGASGRGQQPAQRAFVEDFSRASR